jgi:hypothetical protein
MDGNVPTVTDVERLQEIVTREIGETRAREAMLAVHPEEKPQRPK